MDQRSTFASSKMTLIHSTHRPGFTASQCLRGNRPEAATIAGEVGGGGRGGGQCIPAWDLITV